MPYTLSVGESGPWLIFSKRFPFIHLKLTPEEGWDEETDSYDGTNNLSKAKIVKKIR